MQEHLFRIVTSAPAMTGYPAPSSSGPLQPRTYSLSELLEDVRAASEVVTSNAVASLSSDLLADKPAERNSRESVLDLIDQRLAAIPPSEAETPTGVSLAITLANGQSLLTPNGGGLES